MKKKVLAIVAAVMVLCLGTTVFAADSTTTKATTTTKGVTVSTATTTVKESAATEAKDKGYTVVDVFELSLDSTKATKESDGTYKVVISLAGISKSDSVKVLHYVDNKWEELKATAGDGTVTFNTKTFSPFAIVKDTSAAAKSPKTGTGSELPILAGVALIAMVGFVGYSKKARH